MILWAARWDLQFPISYRDLERMLGDRGLTPRRAYEVTLLRSDGTPAYTIVNDGTLPDSGAAFLVVTDVSLHHPAEMLLKHERDPFADTVQRINRFLDLLCRDLKEPLGAILGVARMLSGCGLAAASTC